MRKSRKIKWKLLRKLAWVNKNIPPGVRMIAGLLLIIGGFLGFLPILGFWMIPLGFGIFILDFRWLRKLQKRKKSR